MGSASRGIRIAQHDLRSVAVDVGPLRFLLRYGFWFDGHDRLPESVVVSGNEVTAFFLSSTVRDRVVVTPQGFEVRRRWTILQRGPARLELTVDVLEAPVRAPRPAAARSGRRKGAAPRARRLRYLFPGVAAGALAGSAPRSYRGERMAVAAGVALAAEDVGVAVRAASDPGGRSVGVGVRTEAGESGDVARLVFAMPAAELFGAAGAPHSGAPYEPGDGAEEPIDTGGHFEAGLVVSIALAAPALVCDALAGMVVPMPDAIPGAVRPSLGEEVRSFLARHLILERGVCGLRVVPGGEMLSAWAGAELAALILRLAPGDPELLETALRLGDFAIGGQHPGGLFYERYALRDRSWVGLRGVRPGRTADTPLLSVEESSRVAASLFDLADGAERLGRPAPRYALAARRMVDAFLDARGGFAQPSAVMSADAAAAAEQGLSAVRFLHPLLRLADRDGRERYRKAALRMVETFLEVPVEPLALPSSREGREPDSKAVLLLLEAALEAGARSIKVRSLPALTGALVPWLRIAHGADRGPPPGASALADSHGRQRWKPRPAQIAWLAAHLAALCPAPRRELLERIGASALLAVGALPFGCSWVSRGSWSGAAEPAGGRLGRLRPRSREASAFSVGPVDARDFVTELGYALRLEEERIW